MIDSGTFLTGGFTIKSSYASSGLTVVKFSCKIAIFFSLSQPAGLKAKRQRLTCFSLDWIREHYAHSGLERTPSWYPFPPSSDTQLLGWLVASGREANIHCRSSSILRSQGQGLRKQQKIWLYMLTDPQQVFRAFPQLRPEELGHRGALFWQRGEYRATESSGWDCFSWTLARRPPWVIWNLFFLTMVFLWLD